MSGEQWKGVAVTVVIVIVALVVYENWIQPFSKKLLPVKSS